MISIDTTTYRLQNSGKLPIFALVFGIAGLALSAVGLLTDAHTFWSAYLVAFAFWLAIALGGLFFTMLHQVTGAVWSAVPRRAAEALSMTLPLLFVFFIPLIFGLHDLYHWSHEEAVVSDELLQWKSPFLNPGFFILRAVLYFAVWSTLAWLLNRESLAQDADGDVAHTVRLRKISAPGMFLFAFTVTFAAFDWLMSLEPHWYSTIFGVYYFTGSFLASLAFMTVFFGWLRSRKVLENVVTLDHFHDFGRLLFAFTVFWAYIGGSQYYLIWYANIPEETVWYLARWDGSWMYVSLALIFGHFAVPFVVLAFYRAKRTLKVLLGIASLILVMHFVDMFWIVMPTFSEHGSVHFSWMHITTMIGIGGVVKWLFLTRFTGNPVVPYNDPKFKDSVAHRV
jgi:hypothetical protein